MTQEEKAKAYDEALKVLHKYDGANIMFSQSLKEEMFPELKESEDERIIKRELIHYFTKGTEFLSLCSVSREQILTWLEKQGEQKPADNIPQEFEKYVEHLLSLSDGEGHGSPAKVKEVSAELFKLAKLEQNPAWSEEDEQMLNTIFDSLNIYAERGGYLCLKSVVKDEITWLKSLKERVQPKQEWKQENTGDLTDFENAMMHIGCSFFGQHAGLNPNDANAIKEQAKLLLELVPNQEWSEKDKIALDDALWCCKQAASIAKNENDMGNVWCAEHWLKSLKPQNTWKPSEEHITICKEVYADILSAKGFDTVTINKELNRLEEELKKLKGE